MSYDAVTAYCTKCRCETLTTRTKHCQWCGTRYTQSPFQAHREAARRALLKMRTEATA